MDFRYERATSLEHAKTLLDAEGTANAKISGGSIGITLLMKQGLLDFDLLVDVREIGQLRAVTHDDATLSIGGAVTMREIASSELIRTLCPALAVACMSVGNTRIRNWTTIGGNIGHADYASDPPAILIAMDAQAEIAGPSGMRLVPVADLIVGPFSTTLSAADIIVRFVIPTARRTSAFLRFSSRSSNDRPAVVVGAGLGVSDAGLIETVRVVVGAAVPSPLVVEAEFEGLRGMTPSPILADFIAEVCHDSVTPLADHRGSANYRKAMTRVLVRNAVAELMNGVAR